MAAFWANPPANPPWVSQMLGSPLRQMLQLPQPLWNGVRYRRWPGRMCSTCSPTASTVPAHSCHGPSTTGRGNSKPTQGEVALPEVPVGAADAAGFDSDQRIPGSDHGSSNSRTTSGSRTPSITTAFICCSFLAICLGEIDRQFVPAMLPVSDRRRRRLPGPTSSPSARRTHLPQSNESAPHGRSRSAPRTSHQPATSHRATRAA